MGIQKNDDPNKLEITVDGKTPTYTTPDKLTVETRTLAQYTPFMPEVVYPLANSSVQTIVLSTTPVGPNRDVEVVRLNGSIDDVKTVARTEGIFTIAYMAIDNTDPTKAGTYIEEITVTAGENTAPVLTVTDETNSYTEDFELTFKMLDILPLIQATATDEGVDINASGPTVKKVGDTAWTGTVEDITNAAGTYTLTFVAEDTFDSTLNKTIVGTINVVTDGPKFADGSTLKEEITTDLAAAAPTEDYIKTLLDDTSAQISDWKQSASHGSIPVSKTRVNVITTTFTATNAKGAQALTHIHTTAHDQAEPSFGINNVATKDIITISTKGRAFFPFAATDREDGSLISKTQRTLINPAGETQATFMGATGADDDTGKAATFGLHQYVYEASDKDSNAIKSTVYVFTTPNKAQQAENPSITVDGAEAAYTNAEGTKMEFKAVETTKGKAYTPNVVIPPDATLKIAILKSAGEKETLDVTMINGDATIEDVKALANEEGVYTIGYMAVDNANSEKVGMFLQTLTVAPAANAPVITVPDILEYDVAQGGKFDIPELKATDVEDGEVTATYKVSVNGTETAFDTAAEVGTVFTFTYTATDSENNVSEPVVITVTITEAAAEGITFTIPPDAKLEFDVGEEFVIPAIVATDENGVKLDTTYSIIRRPGGFLNTDNAWTEATVTSLSGTYSVIFLARDAYGNEATKDVQIKVVDDIPPVIYYNGVDAGDTQTLNLKKNEALIVNVTMVENAAMAKLTRIVTDESNTIIKDNKFPDITKTPGTYKAVYTATDGVATDKLTMTIVVSEEAVDATGLPVITVTDERTGNSVVAGKQVFRLMTDTPETLDITHTTDIEADLQVDYTASIANLSQTVPLEDIFKTPAYYTTTVKATNKNDPTKSSMFMYTTVIQDNQKPVFYFEDVLQDDLAEATIEHVVETTGTLAPNVVPYDNSLRAGKAPVKIVSTIAGVETQVLPHKDASGNDLVLAATQQPYQVDDTGASTGKVYADTQIWDMVKELGTKEGTHKLSYYASQWQGYLHADRGDYAEFFLTVNVVATPDEIAPVIANPDPLKYEVAQGGAFTMPPVPSATDDRDEVVTVNVAVMDPDNKISTTVDTNKVGTHRIIYSAKDIAGNKAEPKEVEVVVKAVADDEKPVITFTFSGYKYGKEETPGEPQTFSSANPYPDGETMFTMVESMTQGDIITVTTNVTDNISKDVELTWEVRENKITEPPMALEKLEDITKKKGNYFVTFTATDDAGNTAEMIVKLTVKEYVPVKFVYNGKTYNEVTNEIEHKLNVGMPYAPTIEIIEDSLNQFTYSATKVGGGEILAPATGKMADLAKAITEINTALGAPAVGDKFTVKFVTEAYNVPDQTFNIALEYVAAGVDTTVPQIAVNDGTTEHTDDFTVKVKKDGAIPTLTATAMDGTDNVTADIKTTVTKNGEAFTAGVAGITSAEEATYVITYTVSDGTNNDTLNVTIHVDATGPVITFKAEGLKQGAGNAATSFEFISNKLGEKPSAVFNLADTFPYTITAKDEVDGAVTYKYEVHDDKGVIKFEDMMAVMNKAGNYRVTITSTDEVGNETSMAVMLYSQEFEKAEVSYGGAAMAAGDTKSVTIAPADVGAYNPTLSVSDGALRWAKYSITKNGTEITPVTTMPQATVGDEIVANTTDAVAAIKAAVAGSKNGDQIVVNLEVVDWFLYTDKAPAKYTINISIGTEVDLTKPTIALNENTADYMIYKYKGQGLTQGVVATDNVDGDLTADKFKGEDAGIYRNVKINGEALAEEKVSKADLAAKYNYDEVGVYEFGYTAKDSSANEATINTLAIVSPAAGDSAPAITVGGKTPTYPITKAVALPEVEAGKVFTPPAIETTGLLKIYVIKNNEVINYNITNTELGDLAKTAGEYTIVYTAKDATGTAMYVHSLKVTGDVLPPIDPIPPTTDKEAPTVNFTDYKGTIVTNVNQNQTVQVGGAVSLPQGYKATDKVDGNVPVKVKATREYNGLTMPYLGELKNISRYMGNYEIVYSAVDKAGNEAVPKVITIAVIDTLAPQFGYTGETEFETEAGSDFIVPDITTATDNKDGTVKVVRTITKNGSAYNGDFEEITKTAGKYVITHNAVDSVGNIAPPLVLTIDVKAAVVPVTDTTPPVITVNDSKGGKTLSSTTNAWTTTPVGTPNKPAEMSPGISGSDGKMYYPPVAKNNVARNFFENLDLEFTAVDEKDGEVEVKFAGISNWGWNSTGGKYTATPRTLDTIMNFSGTYSLYYTATDEAGNVAMIEIILAVNDNVAPAIYYNERLTNEGEIVELSHFVGDKLDITVRAMDPLGGLRTDKDDSDPAWNGNDGFRTTITKNGEAFGLGVNGITREPGTYLITYQAQDWYQMTTFFVRIAVEEKLPEANGNFTNKIAVNNKLMKALANEFYLGSTPEKHMNDDGFVDGDKIKAQFNEMDKELSLPGYGIKEVEGLNALTNTGEYIFEGLTVLDLAFNELRNITEFDSVADTVSELYINDNNIQVLDLSAYTSLLRPGKTPKIDISNNPITIIRWPDVASSRSAVSAISGEPENFGIVIDTLDLSGTNIGETVPYARTTSMAPLTREDVVPTFIATGLENLILANMEYLNTLAGLYRFENLKAITIDAKLLLNNANVEMLAAVEGLDITVVNIADLDEADIEKVNDIIDQLASGEARNRFSKGTDTENTAIAKKTFINTAWSNIKNWFKS